MNAERVCVLQCVGSGACGFAAWALWDGRGSESAAGRAGLFALVAWGGALALAALAALCGAIRGSAAMLAAAFALLALTGVAEAAAVWWGAAHRPQLERALRDNLEHTVRREYGLVHSRTQLLDVIQQGVSIGIAEPKITSQQSERNGEPWFSSAGMLRRGRSARLAALGVGARRDRRAGRGRARVGRAGPVGGRAGRLLLRAGVVLHAGGRSVRGGAARGDGRRRRERAARRGLRRAGAGGAGAVGTRAAGAGRGAAGGARAGTAAGAGAVAARPPAPLLQSLGTQWNEADVERSSRSFRDLLIIISTKNSARGYAVPDD